MIAGLDKILDKSGRPQPIRLYAAAEETNPQELIDALYGEDGAVLVAALLLAPIVAQSGMRSEIRVSLLALIDLDNRFEHLGHSYELGFLSADQLLLIETDARAGNEGTADGLFIRAIEKLIYHGLKEDLTFARPLDAFNRAARDVRVNEVANLEKTLRKIMIDKKVDAESRYCAWIISENPESLLWSRQVLLNSDEDAGLRALIGWDISARDPALIDELIERKGKKWRLKTTSERFTPISSPLENVPDSWLASAIACSAHGMIRNSAVRQLGRRFTERRFETIEERSGALTELLEGTGGRLHHGMRKAALEKSGQLNGALHAAALLGILGDQLDEPAIAFAAAHANVPTILDFNQSVSPGRPSAVENPLESSAEAAWAALEKLVRDCRGKDAACRILAQIYVELANRFMEMSRRDRAATMFEKALEIIPDHFSARRGRALIK